jgi:hypothetical protein
MGGALDGKPNIRQDIYPKAVVLQRTPAAKTYEKEPILLIQLPKDFLNI